jgi:hypothetical protein
VKNLAFLSYCTLMIVEPGPGWGFKNNQKAILEALSFASDTKPIPIFL